MQSRLSIALLFSLLLPACSGGSGLSSNVDKPAAKKNTDSATSPSGDGAADSETTKSTAPVQVTGAFLTSKCDVAATGEFAAIAGQDAYGCAINNGDGTKYKGVVQFSAIKVNFAKDPAVSAGLNPTLSTNRWHTYFYLPTVERGQIKTFELAGTLDSQRQFNLVYTPGAATSTGTVDPAGSSLAATPCVSSLDFKSPTIYPFNMDVQNSLDTARTFTGTAGGKPVPVLNTNGGFIPGDKITGTFSGSGAVAIDKTSGVADPLYIYQCDYTGWKLFFQDSSGAILNSGNASIGLWLKNGGTVPNNAVTATVGYSEPSDKTYKDNEGNFLDLGINAVRIGGGCNYTFHVERACK